jgi:Pyruvate/2-oxoacid:ferredoxin oxidoreductase gamma subunit
MVGVLAGVRLLPFGDAAWQEALKRVLPAKLLDANQKAFEAGFRFGTGA